MTKSVATIPPTPHTSLAPTNMTEALQFSELVSKSGMVPKQYAGKPADIFVAIQWGAEVGLGPLQALQSIAVINGRPTLWGDAMLALVQGHPDYEYHNEYVEDNVAHCVIKRKGSPEYDATFSTDEAKKAGLLGKQGPWTQYTERMLQLRARGFALRDKFADALRGIVSAEEVQDYSPQVVSPDIEVVAEQKPTEEMATEKHHKGLEALIAGVADHMGKDRNEAREKLRGAIARKWDRPALDIHLSQLTKEQWQWAIDFLNKRRAQYDVEQLKQPETEDVPS